VTGQTFLIATGSRVKTLELPGLTEAGFLTSDDVLEAEEILQAVGREPCVDGLGLEAAGIDLDPKGYIATDGTQRSTRRPHIFAAGDAAGPYEILHVAVRQGELAARNAARWRGRLGGDLPVPGPRPSCPGRRDRRLGEAGGRARQRPTVGGRRRRPARGGTHPRVSRGALLPRHSTGPRRHAALPPHVERSMGFPGPRARSHRRLVSGPFVAGLPCPRGTLESLARRRGPSWGEGVLRPANPAGI
jgi:hypothetical protein